MNWKDRYKTNPFELIIDTIKGQCHYMEKEDIYEWIYSDEKEIERLNNVINELEKDLTKILEDMYNSLVHIEGRGYYSASLVPLEDELDKLKELKEGKK